MNPFKAAIGMLALGALLPLGASATSALGFEMGKTSPEDLSRVVDGRSEITSLGSNYYTHDPMLLVPGRIFDLQGLKDVVFIFKDSPSRPHLLLGCPAR